jgi:transposase
MSNNIIGIDLAKNIFQAHKATKSGKKIWSKKLNRKELLELMAKEAKSIVAMEACAGAHYFAQEFQKMGHEVKLIPAQYVKPYVKTNKNDAADADAICEASGRKNMRFTAIKSKEQQTINQIHKSRAMQITNRTALINEIRGFLLELGIALPVGVNKFLANCREALNKREDLPVMFVENINNLLKNLKVINEQVEYYDLKVRELFKLMPEAKRLATIPGVGELTATAILALVPDINCFKKSRDLSAYLGLVPRQFSSGGKTCLGRISKRGNRYLRRLLFQGAMSVIRYQIKGTGKENLWLKNLLLRIGVRKAAIALANKNARIICALLKNPEQQYVYHYAI